MVSYATPDELLAQTGADAADAAVLDIVNAGVSRAIDGYCGRRFFSDDEPSARVFNATDPVSLDVQDFSTDEGLVVETDDNADGIFESTWLAGDYQLEPLNAPALGRPYRQLIAIDVRIWPTGVWLAGSPFEMASYPTRARRACVRITAKWGWAAVPDDVKQAHLIQCGRIFKRRDAPFGTAGSNDMGELRMLASRLDPDTQVLLAPYRLGGKFAGPGSTRVR